MNNPTRMEEQRKIDDLYASGEISQEDWSKRFDELSSSRWNAQGKVPEKTEK